MENYIKQIKEIEEISFSTIRDVAWKNISHLPKIQRDKLWSELKRGTALLDTNEHMCQYLFSFGNMHQAKLLDAIKQLPEEVIKHPFEVIDWGCGQALGTVNLFDYLNKSNLLSNLEKVTLIEPSKVALERGILHTEAYAFKDLKIVSINDFFENITPEQIKSDNGLPVVHIFSNILDVAQIDLKYLANLIDSAVLSDNYLVCVGPLNPTNRRIDAFFRYFNEGLIYKLYEFESYSFINTNWTYKGKIYRLEYNQAGHLIPIEYYPNVQFQAAYELDLIRSSRKETLGSYNTKFSHFEVAAPFDLGASVYDDVHPIFAVIHNIISRGLPTKASIYIEREIVKAFNLSKEKINYGEIIFQAEKEIDYIKLEADFHTKQDNSWSLSDEQLIEFQLLLTPIAIARFHKVLIEAIITGQLSLNQTHWKVMVEEEDVPFASLAINDFKQLFYHLTKLSEKYSELNLPEIELNILSNETFFQSPLHLGADVYKKLPFGLINQEYDLVVTLSMFKSVSSSIESFSKFKSKNNCYFNIRNINYKRSERIIYTSNRIKYNSLVDKDDKGNYSEVEGNKKLLTYFLQLLFRKQVFRSGQLPILDRALKNLPVIGLLPTGGGKSLTYQIAALLQPGVTMVIDPLKSLMKDQYDGLINSGIDFAEYINSTQSSNEKKIREHQLESSQLMFVFLSPERLSINSFRERLKNMHNHNVYFSYGVIDEVHCVSEWGHDFRFSYLHLGRNLYNYVKAKEGEISLFGLTATASFDVLADVERELSGNGAFTLDNDVTIRYENTNRLELQYKIEKIPIQFEEDNYYDRHFLMPLHLPKAVNITNHWPAFDTKKQFLVDYLKRIPLYINEIQSAGNIEFIKDKFVVRQNNNEGTELDLTIEMPDDFYSEKILYNQAGIVFCPHVNKTGLSVSINSENIKNNDIPDAGSFSGQDNDNSSMQNLEYFRNNKSPLMVATKAFGMGIDKPNVRFTVNMNYSSSLESFVQEAGRAGRDRKMALATILLSDYKLVKIKSSYQGNNFPLGIIKNKWFHENDYKEISNHFNLNIPLEDLMVATPSIDIVKLHCSKDNKMFSFNECSNICEAFSSCNLRKVNPLSKGWKAENELIQELRVQNLNLGKKYFQYLNADYQTVMYFFNQSFKGDIIERTYMNNLLNKIEVFVKQNSSDSIKIPKQGFLKSLIDADNDERVIIFVPYTEEDYADLSKAIYRMCCIELIEDFTQDYTKHQFRIIAVRKNPGKYYEGLRNFLTRYFTLNRAEIELQKVYDIKLNGEGFHEIEEEIYKCLRYLTIFVYDKISEKRKKAIDEMRNFCVEGLNEDDSWIGANEKLKDFIYYYFNSKYAKSDFIAETGEPFSLVVDTDGGKISDNSILFKYLRVIDDDIVGVGTPLDNIKHLYGAVRLISRSLTDSNPTLSLLEAFCLAYMDTKKNIILENQLVSRYSEGMIEESIRSDNPYEFWEVFESFNEIFANHMEPKDLKILKEETSLLIHSNYLKDITLKYTL